MLCFSSYKEIANIYCVLTMPYTSVSAFYVSLNLI